MLANPYLWHALVMVLPVGELPYNAVCPQRRTCALALLVSTINILHHSEVQLQIYISLIRNPREQIAMSFISYTNTYTFTLALLSGCKE